MLNKLSFNLANELNESETKAHQIKKQVIMESNRIVVKEADEEFEDPRAVVLYHLNKGEFEKAVNLIKDYGLEDELEEFIDDMKTSGARMEFRKFVEPMLESNNDKLKGKEILNEEKPDIIDVEGRIIAGNDVYFRDEYGDTVLIHYADSYDDPEAYDEAYKIENGGSEEKLSKVKEAADKGNVWEVREIDEHTLEPKGVQQYIYGEEELENVLPTLREVKVKTELEEDEEEHYSKELEDLVKEQLSYGTIPDEIEYKGKTYKAFNVTDLETSGDTSKIYYCNMDKTPNGDPQESDDYFFVSVTLNATDKGYNGVNKVNFVEDLTESEEPQPRKLTREQFNKEFGPGTNPDVINAGREPENRIEVIDEEDTQDDQKNINQSKKEELEARLGEILQSIKDRQMDTDEFRKLSKEAAEIDSKIMDLDNKINGIYESEFIKNKKNGNILTKSEVRDMWKNQAKLNKENNDEDEYPFEKYLADLSNSGEWEFLHESDATDTTGKRIARYDEFDNGHVLHSWSELTFDEAEEEARKASLENQDSIFYVAYDNVMDPRSDYNWYRGEKYPISSVKYKDGKAYIEESEQLHEAEVTNLKTVKSQGNVYMLEDDNKQVIVGENYNEAEGLIDNAEIYESKEEADKDYFSRCDIDIQDSSDALDEGIIDDLKIKHLDKKAKKQYNKAKDLFSKAEKTDEKLRQVASKKISKDNKVNEGEDFKEFADNEIRKYYSERKNNNADYHISKEDLIQDILDKYLPQDIGLSYQEAKDYNKIPPKYLAYLDYVLSKEENSYDVLKYREEMNRRGNKEAIKSDMKTTRNEMNESDDIERNEFLALGNVHPVRGSMENKYKMTVKATEEVEQKAKDLGLKYYVSADAESGPEADNPEFYDVYGTVEDLMKFEKSLRGLNESESSNQQADALIVDYFKGNMDLEDLHNELINLFGNTKDAFEYLRDNEGRLKN